MTVSLANYDRAKSALAACERLDEAQDIADRSAALAAYAKQANDAELEATARRIRARAFRRLGELSAALPKAANQHAARSTAETCKIETLNQAGISKAQAHRAERIAAIPAAEFERRIERSQPDTIADLVGNKRARPGRGHNNDDEWYTPEHIVEAARECMGKIDLDPASNPHANKVVKAARYFTAEDNGLVQQWGGRVFMNPPYSQPFKSQFIEKLAHEFQAERVSAACVVLSCDFSTRWFEPLRPIYTAICLMRGRVQFYKEHPGDRLNPAFGTSVIFVGPDTTKFANAFGGLGEVVGPLARQT